jgi:hypothetical protein
MGSAMKRAYVAIILVLITTVSVAAQTIDPAVLQQLVNQLNAVVQQLNQLAVVPTPPPPPPAGNTVKVAAGADLQAAINAALPGTTILVAPATYSHAGNFVLPKKTGTGTIIIRTDGLDDVAIPPSVRINPALSSRMAKLAVTDTLLPTLSTEDGASNYVFIGIEILPNPRNPERDALYLGRLDATTLAQLPSNIVLDRMYIHADATVGGKRGIDINAINWVIRNSYISGYVFQGADSQAILTINSPGPGLVENNYLEASGENIMVGGGDPKIPNVVPSDIVFRGNTFAKPQAWKQKRGSVKNLFELKLCKHCLAENNVFDGVWPDSQTGYAVQLTNRNQDGTAPWSTVQDVTMRYNLFKNVEGPILNMLGLDDRAGIPDVQGTNVVFENNLILAATNGFAVNNGFVPTIIRHNTIVTFNGGGWFLNFSNNPIPSGQFTFQDNLIPSTQYGISANGPTIGAPSLQAGAPNAVFTNNTIEGPPAGFIQYPANNTLVAPGTLTGRFDARKRYAGTELGHDGLKVGADIDGLIQRIPWATW